MMKMEESLNQQMKHDVSSFPLTRFMGSKRKLLDFIVSVANEIEYETVLDAFSGSGCVSYLFKSRGKEVTSNDFLAYSYHIANATIANSKERLSDRDLRLILANNPDADDFIQRTFNGLYYTPEDNAFLDKASANIQLLGNKYRRSLAIASLCRAAMKKQPRGVFTVVGHRYDDGRRDLRLTMEEQFLQSASAFNKAVFDNGCQNKAFNKDLFSFKKKHFDLVYLDPPYYSPHSDNDYIRRYHFVEGLATYWKGVEIRENSKTKRIEKRDTPFASRSRIYEAFDYVFASFPNSKFLVSYSSNSIPTKEEMIAIMRKYRKHVKCFEYDHKYSFGTHNHKVNDNRNSVQEYLFLAE